MQPYFHRVSTAHSVHVASLIFALIGINLYIHKATFLLLVKTVCSTAASFNIFLCQHNCKLTVWNVVDVLARSSISRSHCSPLSPSCNKSSFYFSFFSFYFAIFLPWPLPSCYCFRCLCCHAVLRFSPPFLILATIFIGVSFSLLLAILSLFSQTAIITAFHKTGPFFCWIAVFAPVLSLPYSFCC